jgi:glyoxylase-like metal-dependent hydrolase (beta-lactamase superfamily II)
MSWRLGIVEVGVIPRLPLNMYVPDASPDALIDPPCYCYLATDGERNILVDSGPDRARSGAANLEIVGDTSALLTAGLKTWGIAPSDIDCIVHTHLHHDHMQNDLMFPNAVVHVQRAELAWATGPDCGRFYVGVGEIATELGDRLRTIEGDAQLFKGLRVVLNGGHTPGHQSVIVDTPEKAVCLCGDIVSLFANVEVVGSICPNSDETVAFLDRARTAGWEMVPSHDPELRGHRWYLAPSDETCAAIARNDREGGGLS